MARFDIMNKSDGTNTTKADVTAIGTKDNQNILYIPCSGADNKPSILALDAVDGSGNAVTYYLWVDNTGDLRIGSIIPTNEDGEGTVVGAQS